VGPSSLRDCLRGPGKSCRSAEVETPGRFPPHLRLPLRDFDSLPHRLSALVGSSFPKPQRASSGRNWRGSAPVRTRRTSDEVRNGLGV
jgi:hypothetical protein